VQEGSRVDPDRDSKPGCSRRRNSPRSRPLLRQRERARMDRREGRHRCRPGRARPAAPQSPPDTAGILADLATSDDRPGSAALTRRTDIARPRFGAGQGCAASTFWRSSNPLGERLGPTYTTNRSDEEALRGPRRLRRCASAGRSARAQGLRSPRPDRTIFAPADCTRHAPTSAPSAPRVAGNELRSMPGKVTTLANRCSGRAGTLRPRRHRSVLAVARLRRRWRGFL
jgi:hypothetical protein